MPPKKNPDHSTKLGIDSMVDNEKDKDNNQQSCFDDSANQHLIRAAQIYRILSNRDQVLFLQRNLTFSNRRFLNITKQAAIKRKLSLTDDDSRDSKRRKISRCFTDSVEFESYNTDERRHADGLQIVLESVDDDSGLFDKIEVEANVLKLNGGVPDVSDKDAMVIHRLGSFEVYRNQKKRPPNNSSTGNGGNNSPSLLKSTVDIPADAFSPLNGHLSWCSWLILRFHMIGPKLTDRILRRFGHRKSSRWLLGNSHQPQSRIALLPLCKSGETSLTGGEIDLILSPDEETDEHLLNGLRNVLSNKCRSSPPHKFIDKNDARIAWVRVQINWRRRKTAESNRGNFLLLSSADIPYNHNANNTTAPAVRFSRGINDYLLLNGLSLKFLNNHCSPNNNRFNHSTNGYCNTTPNKMVNSILSTSNSPKYNGGGPQKNLHISTSTSSLSYFQSKVPKTLCYRFNCFRNESNCITCRLHSVASNPSRCPFCNVWAEDTYFLMKHLRMSHPRFVFYYKEKNQHSSFRHLIEVAINADFDNRLEILPNFLRFSDVVKHRQKAKSKKWHFRLMFYWRKKNEKDEQNERPRNLDEFKFNGTGLFMKRPRSAGRQRQYYHSQTCAPILPGETDVDSENELDPEWLRITRCRLIDEFSDVNDGEKRIMKLWNLHVMKHNYFGDNTMFTACQTFLVAHHKRMRDDGGFKNFLLHLTSMYKYGLLNQQQILALSSRVNEIKRS